MLNLKQPPAAIAAVILTLATASVLLGCASTAPPTAAPTFVRPTAPPLADDVLVIYHRSGGIAGTDETFTIHHGGLLELQSRSAATKSLQVNEPIIQPLRSLLEQPDFAKLDALYQATGADLITYTVTAHTAGGGTKTVTTMDGAKPPSYLGVVIGMLEQLRMIVEKNG